MYIDIIYAYIDMYIYIYIYKYIYICRSHDIDDISYA